MKYIKHFFRGLMALGMTLWTAACSDDPSEASRDRQEVHTYRIAAWYPEGEAARWQRTADWVNDIMAEAQRYKEKSVRLEIAWHSDQAADLQATLEQAATDEQTAALVGPSDADKASAAARLCMPSRKPLLLPTTANAEFQRIYASKDYVFCLTQNDIMQAEIMFSLLQNNYSLQAENFNKVALIASGDSYGDTFRQWFGYLATEKFLQTDYIGILGDDHPVEKAVREWIESSTANASYSPFLCFASSNSDDLLRADAELTRIKTENESPLFFHFNRLFCTGMQLTDQLAAQVQNTYEGVEIAPNPTSGFSSIYEAKFGESPVAGEAQLFDAVVLLYYSLIAMEAHDAPLFTDGQDDLGQPARLSSLNAYLEQVVDGRENAPKGWLASNASYLIDELWQGHYPDIDGVSSDLTFDARYHCAVTHSVYRHWRLHNGRRSTLQYLSADGSDHTVSSIEEWSTQVQVIQQLQPEESKITYSPHTGNYAVVVASSSRWSNYRHQADALAMYQLLKQQGYDDDHILLILEDDIAQNTYNRYPGVVKVTPDGENLYHDLQIDYKMSDLTPYDLQNIFCGEVTRRTPVVLPSGAGDNVLVFWSGHGDYGLLNYGTSRLTALDLLDTLTAMKQRGMFRKLLFVIEACYSGSVAEYCEGIDGVLFLTAANNAETSKADMKDETLNVYLSNGFTRAFQSKVTENPSVTLRDLFYHVATQTVGSHAGLYNQSRYGNVFTETMAEFMAPGQ